MGVSMLDMRSREFDRAVETIKDNYHDLEKSLRDARKQLREYDNDAHIKRLEAEISDLHKNSLLMLSPVERDAIQEFKTTHYELHREVHQKSAGSTFIYEITGTGFGHCIKIKCPICNGVRDVTDTSAW